MRIVRTAHADAADMAHAHAGAFEPGWTEEDFDDLLDGDGVFGFLARDKASRPVGVILCRVAADEMEVLTVGVRAEARRTGVAKALILAALTAAKEAGAQTCFLEVAVDNGAASTLYERLGFQQSGLRKAYYDRGPAGFTDARVMRRALNGEPA